jgi:hypothetical protein
MNQAHHTPASGISAIRVVLTAALVVMLLGTTGCVRRRMTVRSNPPGARVYVDDIEIGTTPVSTYFTYYAARKITLIKDGYRTETTYHRILPPWYEIPPLDFVSDNFVPYEVRDERVVDFQLVPQENVPLDELLGRAENLRQNARQGTITPLIPGQGGPPQPETLPPTQPNIGLPGQGLPDNAPLPYPLPTTEGAFEGSQNAPQSSDRSNEPGRSPSLFTRSLVPRAGLR